MGERSCTLLLTNHSLTLRPPLCNLLRALWPPVLRLLLISRFSGGELLERDEERRSESG